MVLSSYQNAKIYKIINSIDGQIYVGSTITSLSQRFAVHKSKSKRHPNIKLYRHFTELGVDHFEIILIKNYPCKNKTELAIEEERLKLF
jgi:predicted GIY-YIG superfamily endonuclease